MDHTPIPDTLLFFDGMPQAYPLYAAIERAIRAACGGVSIRVQKTQITFANRRVFACVSLPRRKPRPGEGASLTLSFGLGYRLDSPRVCVAVEPYPNRWTHHVPVTRAQEIDGELLAWIREAYDFSMAKR